MKKLFNFLILATCIYSVLAFPKIVHRWLPTHTNSAYEVIFENIDEILILLMLSSIYYALVMSVFVHFISFIEEKFLRVFDLINAGAAIYTFVFFGLNLLRITTPEQFSLIATFIGLPFVTILPKLIAIVFKKRK